MSTSREEETAKLFGTDPVPSVPETSDPVEPVAPRNDTPPSEFPLEDYRDNTLDESIMATFKRDLIRIGLNLKLVLLPFLKSQQKSRSLGNWDLWGPLLFILLLGIILSSSNSDSTSAVFTMAFIVLGVGAVILTLNILLLGGTIVFFQSLCLLGYCLFPIVLAAFIVSFDNKWFIAWPITILGVAWADYASYTFVKEASPPERRGLAMYPVFLLYLCVGWMVIVM